MKSSKLLAILFLASQIIFKGAAFAQASAATVLASCSAAMGSDHADTGFVGEGDISYSDGSRSAHVIWKALGHHQFRQEILDNNGPSVYVVNHGVGFREKDGKREKQPFHITAYHRPEFIPALACRNDTAHPGIMAELLGAELLDGRSVYHIRFSLAPRGRNQREDAVNALISEYELFIDSSTSRVAAIRTWVFSPNAVENRSIWQAFYSDYRDVNGVAMPFHIQDRTAGQDFRSVSLTTITTDATITDRDFQ